MEPGVEKSVARIINTKQEGKIIHSLRSYVTEFTLTCVNNRQSSVLAYYLPMLSQKRFLRILEL